MPRIIAFPKYVIKYFGPYCDYTYNLQREQHWEVVKCRPVPHQSYPEWSHCVVDMRSFLGSFCSGSRVPFRIHFKALLLSMNLSVMSLYKALVYSSLSGPGSLRSSPVFTQKLVKSSNSGFSPGLTFSNPNMFQFWFQFLQFPQQSTNVQIGY